MARAVYITLSAGLAVIRICDYRPIGFFVKTENIHGTNGVTRPAANTLIQIVPYYAHGFVTFPYSVRPNAFAERRP